MSGLLSKVRTDPFTATNPPVMNVIWPQDGMLVSGTSMTLRGTMSDETGTVQAQVVDGDVNTNTVTGLVERNGMFWLEDLPLGIGDNTVMVTATDAAGNMTTTNLTVSQSDLILTIDGTPTGDDLWHGSGYVSGRVGDPNATVIINGTNAVVDGANADGTYNWTATGVPIYGMGTATFDAVAYPGGSSGSSKAMSMNASTTVTPPANASLAVEMQPYVALVSYHGNEREEYNAPWGMWYTQTDKKQSAKPVAGANGQWILNDRRSIDKAYYDHLGGYLDYGDDKWMWSISSPDDVEIYHEQNGGTPSDGPGQWPPLDGQDLELLRAVPYEDLSWNVAGGPWSVVRHYYDDEPAYHWDYGVGGTFDLSMKVRTQMKLFTGGKAKVSRNSLFCITAGATEYGKLPQGNSGYPWWNTPETTVDPTKIKLLGWLTFGHHLDSNGKIYCVLPDNDAVDLNLRIPGVKHYNAWVTQQKVIPDVQLSADVSHTKNLSFYPNNQTSPSNPFRFWVNDDDDTGNIVNTGVPGSGFNGRSSQVNGRSDLIDFFPVGVKIGTPNLSPPDAFEYRLCGSDSLRFVYADPTQVGPFDYLTDAAGVAAYGLNLNTPAYSADTIQLNSYGVILSDAFTNKLFHNNGTGTVLMESSGPVSPSSPLQLQVYYHGQEIYSTNLYLSISGVEDMYRWINLRSSGGMSTSTGNPKNNPDRLSNGTNVIFLHGFYVTAYNARGWSAEVFKRLYWSGSKAMFWGVTWDSDLGLITAFNFPRNAANAFVTAANLNAQIKDIPGTKVIMAHSLGNMVVSSAIQDYDLPVDKYFMLEAAVASESYNPAMFNDTTAGNAMVHEDWIGYNTNTWTANWHKLFFDSRTNLTWIDRFPKVRDVAYNFYSTGDECMELYTDGNPGFWTGTYSSFARYCWQKQELWKGRNGAAGTSWAGWGFEGHNIFGVWVPEYITEAANAASPSQLQSDPVFTHAPSTLFSSSIAQSDINNLLAQGIPALSPPTGGGSLSRVRANHDVNGDDFKNGWGRSGGDYDTRWLHSDMKDMAYPYTHKIYDKLVEEGGLQ